MELLGIGRQAEVYAVGEDECLKLFYSDCPRSVVEGEAERMRFVCEHGVPAPRFIALEERDGRLGIRMERLRGVTLLVDALKFFKPDRDYGGLLGRAQRDYHRVDASGLGDMTQALRWQIGQARALDAAESDALIRLLDDLPRGDRLVHMDYHSDNVVMTPGGLRVIDWAGACAGNPLADAARTVLTMETRTYPADADEYARAFINETSAACLEQYLAGYGFQPAQLEEMVHWKPVIAASRLFCCPAEEAVQNMALIRAYLRGA